MSEIITLTLCLAPYVSKTELKQLRHIVLALLGMTGRVTMLGVSRWTADGGSYRTIQRLFQTPMEWGLLLWTVVRTHLLDPQGVYVLAGDDVVVSKAGKRRMGWGVSIRALPGGPFRACRF